MALLNVRIPIKVVSRSKSEVVELLAKVVSSCTLKFIVDIFLTI
jgi:hypothetical protein